MQPIPWEPGKGLVLLPEATSTCFSALGTELAPEDHHLTCSQPLCLTTVMRTQPLRATVTSSLASVAPPTPNSGGSHCDHRLGHKAETGICCFCRCAVAPALTSLWAPDPPSSLLQPSPCECISPALATSPRPEPEPELE